MMFQNAQRVSGSRPPTRCSCVVIAVVTKPQATADTSRSSAVRVLESVPALRQPQRLRVVPILRCQNNCIVRIVAAPPPYHPRAIGQDLLTEE